MLQLRCESDLAQEPLGADGRREIRAQHLHRDVAVVPGVAGEIDRGHAAVSKLALDDVVPGERGAEPGNGIGHVGLPGRGGEA